MSNRRSYGNNSGGGGGNYNHGGRYQGGGGGGGVGGVNPWQSGTSPNRGGIPSLLNQQSLLNQLSSPESQLALATKLLSSILPVAQQGNPPSLLSLGGGGGFRQNRFGGGNNFPDDSRFRRDDRGGRFDQYKNQNRRQQNDRNRKGRNDGQKAKPKDNNASANKASQGEKKQDNENGVTDKEAAGDVEKMAVDETPEGEKKESEPMEEYVGVPPKLLHCHVCGKTMWNDTSYDTHIKGRNHLQKMRELDDSYQVQTNLMRQIAAISLKLDEVRRGKRRPYPDQYCKMCDLTFNGMTMFAHRSTEEHQGLKRFIHPSCNLCNADFKARLEYDEHILTPQHLQMEAKQQARKELYESDPKYVQLRQEETKFRFMLEELNLLSNTSQPTKLTEDEKKTVADLELPPWNPEIELPMLAETVVAAEGFLCKVCKVFVASKEAADLHVRTQKHYETFVTRSLDRLNRKKDKDDDKRKNSGKDESEAKRLKMDEDGDNTADTTQEAEGADESQVTENQPEAAVEEKEETPPQTESESTKGTPPSARKNTSRRGRGGRGRK